MTIEDLMHQPAITCHREDDLQHAAGLMWDHDCGALPVVDRDGRLLGVITDRDICMAAYTQGRALNALQVEQAMSKQVVACQRTDSVDEAERLMSQHQIRRLPVVEGDRKVVGIVSLADVVRRAAKSKGHGMLHQLVNTLSQISAPRAAEARAAE